MNCKSTVEMLSAYLDRELVAQERDAVRSHLADCDRCRAEERDLRALKGLLLGVRAPEPAVDFEQRLISRLREEAAAPVRRRIALPQLRPLVWGQLGGLAATAALAVFGSLLMLRTPEANEASISIPRAATTVAHTDYDAYAERYQAYTEGDEFTAGSSLLTTNYAP